MRERFIRFMQGRYGIDSFGKFLLYFSLLLLFVCSVFKIGALYILGLATLVYAYFRVFSRNFFKRTRENTRYLGIKSRVTGFFKNTFTKNGSTKDGYSSRCNSYSGNNDAAAYKIFKCPRCSQKLRVPRGKGKISITCRRCGHEFIKRS